jgi:undecaprenyl diphosphate synthase
MLGLFRKKKNTQIPPQAPAHIAFIMDGNRRWAKRRGMPGTYGHQKGAAVIDDVCRYLFKRGVRIVSFFAFSTENWARSKEEVDFLMNLMVSEMPAHIETAKKEGVRIRFIGRRDRIPSKAAKMFAKAEKDTTENTNGTIVFAIDYSGQDEIVRAVSEVVGANEPKVAEQNSPITTEDFETFMDTGDLLPIDLVVRTSGEQRISNFMLWKLAYAELSFIQEDWPDMTPRVLERILEDFANRQRRFGK